MLKCQHFTNESCGKIDLGCMDVEELSKMNVNIHNSSQNCIEIINNGTKVKSSTCVSPRSPTNCFYSSSFQGFDNDIHCYTYYCNIGLNVKTSFLILAPYLILFVIMNI